MFQATQKCGINGIEYEDGALIEEKDIHPGSLKPALAAGLIVQIPDPTPDQSPEPPPKKAK